MKSTSVSPAFLVLAMASLPSLLHAQAKVGLQFLSDRQAAGLEPTEVAGIPLTEQSNWNYTDNSATGTEANILSPLAGTLANSAGVATTITVAWSAAGTWNTTNGITTPASKLLNGYIDNTGSGATVDFTGIPYATYSVVVYFGSDGNNRTGQVNSDTAGVAYSYLTNSQFGRPVTAADFKLTSDTGAGNPTANYCIFTNQTADDFSVNIIRGNNNSGFHAIQIVEGGDTDDDGMPDSYEILYGLNPLVDDKALDLDSDGSQNFAEFTLGTKPNNPDTDADGLRDGAETGTGTFVSVNDAGTNPLVADTDRDSLLDGAEPITGPGNLFVTNPLLRDTDGDGYTDDFEITKSTDPTSAQSNPSAVSAGTISINFTGGYNNASAAVTGTAGTGTYARSNWNNKDLLTGFYSALVDETNTATGAGVTWNSNNTWAVADPAANPPFDGDAALMNGYLDTTDVSTTTVQVENVPYRRYDVILYIDGDVGDGSRAGSYTVNGVTRTGISDAANWPVAAGGGVYSEAVSNSSPGNYLVFRNVTGGTLSIAATPTTAARVRAPLNGIQIIGAVDGDSDGMPDHYEVEYAFNPQSAADGALDADNDGVTNAAEYLKNLQPKVGDTDSDLLADGVETGTGTYTNPGNTGSNPLTPDTDGDGLPDGEEVQTHQTNPVARDTDTDGYNDAYEVRYGTQPNNTASPAPDAVRAIGIHFNVSPERTLLETEDAGFLLTRQTHWNNADTSISGTTANIQSPVAGELVDNTGAQVPVEITWAADTAYLTTNGTANPDSKLIGGYLDNTGTVGNTINLTGIPYSSYDVIVYYGSDGNNRTGSVFSSTTSEEFFYRTAANVGAAGFAKDGYLESTSIDPGAPQNSNFVRFTGLNAPAFDVQINRGDNNSGIFAIQIVERAATQVIPVTSVTRNAAGAVTITWESTAGATYDVQRTSTLADWATIAPSVPSGGTSTTYQDTTVNANVPRVFYRVRQN